MRTLHALLLLSVAGCAANVPGEKEEHAGPSFEDDSADGWSESLEERGLISYGQTVEASYSDFGYAGYSFFGRAGAQVAISLVGLGSDPVLTVVGPKPSATWTLAPQVAQSDDYSGLDSFVDFALPATGMYLVVAEEYWGTPGGFVLSLSCSGALCSDPPPPPPRSSDCRSSGCPMGRSCDLCWGRWQCVMDGLTC